MKTIKYKYHKTYGNPKEIREAKIFVDDLRMIQNRWGNLLANVEYIGIITILEIDGVSVKKTMDSETHKRRILQIVVYRHRLPHKTTT